MTTTHDRREQALATERHEDIAPQRPSTADGPTPTPTPTGGRLGAVIRSEFLRLRSRRSTYLLLGTAVLLLVGFAGMAGPMALAFVAEGYSLDEIQLTGPSLFGSQFTPVPIAVLGVLFITSEARSGGLRTSYLAAPRRWPVLVAKTVVLGVAVFATGLVAYAAALLLGAASISATVEPVWDLLWTPATLTSIVGGALVMTFTAWFGLGLGAVTRSTAGGLSVVVVLMFVLPLFIFNLRDVQWLLDAVPSTNDTLLTAPRTAGDFLRGVLADTIWAGVLLGLGGALLQRRDA